MLQDLFLMEFEEATAGGGEVKMLRWNIMRSKLRLRLKERIVTPLELLIR